MSRSEWPVRVYRLGDEPGDDLSGTTSVEARVAMMWPLALQAWELAGLSIPRYERQETPVSCRPWPPPTTPSPAR